MSKLDQNKYYKKAREASLDEEYLGMKILKKYSLNAKKVLDVGCGEGTRLRGLVNSKREGTGIDINKYAIAKAKKQYKDAEFLVYDGLTIPFSDSEFDLVYSAFVLEHVENPEHFLNEMIRVLSTGGYLVLMAPNYGAPNRSSPPYNKSRFAKLVVRTIGDLAPFAQNKSSLRWEAVVPITDKNYEMDYDTTVEPYLRTLLEFLKFKRMNIKYWSVGWDYELENPKQFQKVIRILGELNIYPFKYWGPHLIIVAKKYG